MHAETPASPKLYEPSPQELRDLAEMFDRLAGRIEFSKENTRDLPTLVNAMMRNYPLEAGRLFGECLRVSGFIELDEYVHPTGARPEPTSESDAGLAFQVGAIYRLCRLAASTGCPEVWGIVWAKALGSWAVLRCPARFPADLMAWFHPCVRAFDDCGPEFSVLSGYLPTQVFLQLQQEPAEQVWAEMWEHANAHIAGCRFCAAQLRVEADECARIDQEAGTMLADDAAGLRGFVSADTLWQDQGIRKSRLSEGVKAGKIKSREAPPGTKSDGKRVRLLYNQQDAIRYARPKRLNSKIRCKRLGRT